MVFPLLFGEWQGSNDDNLWAGYRRVRARASDIVKLWEPVGVRQVRVTQSPPGGQSVDVTSQYADGLLAASDALLKAVAVLKKLDA